MEKKEEGGRKGLTKALVELERAKTDASVASAVAQLRNLLDVDELDAGLSLPSYWLLSRYLKDYVHVYDHKNNVIEGRM